MANSINFYARKSSNHKLRRLNSYIFARLFSYIIQVIHMHSPTNNIYSYTYIHTYTYVYIHANDYIYIQRNINTYSPLIDVDCMLTKIHRYLGLHIKHSIRLDIKNDIYKKHSFISKQFCLHGVWHVVFIRSKKL